MVFLASKKRKARGRFYFFVMLLLGASLVTLIDSQLRPTLIAIAEVMMPQARAFPTTTSSPSTRTKQADRRGLGSTP
ncbi:MAG: hypothetical protein DDT38_00379 [Firmicutes bacterium]|nr:hypothetical protein [candidate division NPL-UPA2 bacterium]